jgi:uncharacterized surface protein with fasciclin (FAS1) repeats
VSCQNDPKDFFESVYKRRSKSSPKGKFLLYQNNPGGIMKRSLTNIIGAALIGVFGAVGISGQMMEMGGENPIVGGAPMYKTKNIVENAVNSKDHTTLVAAVKAAGLVETLSGKGPFTVFAPVNNAFDALPAGTVDTLLKPENRSMLIKVLTYHVVSGNMDSKSIARSIKQGGGKAELNTVAGGRLWARMDGDALLLTDEKGGTSRVTIADVRQSNGVIHVIDAVLLPN